VAIGLIDTLSASLIVTAGLVYYELKHGRAQAG